MQDKIRISAVIPTYNRAHTVTRAIDSILGQEYAPSEIIVVDDGSNDNTRKILEAYGEKIRYVYQENTGVSGARNRGVNEANYEWIAFLDSDDYWLPHHLSNIVAAMDLTECKASLYFSDTRLAPDEGESSLWGLCRFKVSGPCLFADDAGEWAFLHRQPIMLQSSVIRRKAYFEVKALPENMIIAEDTLLFYKLIFRYPACAVRGFGTIMTSDGTQRLTHTHDGQSIVYWQSTIQLYKELLSNENKISGKYRKRLNQRLSQSYLGLSRFYYRKRKFPMLFRYLLIGAMVSPGSFARELSGSIERVFAGWKSYFLSYRSTDRYADLFDTSTITENLRDKSIFGGLNVMASEVMSLALSLGSTMVLARLLMPEHFGLISMVTALLVFAERFKDLGLDVATIQSREITHEQVSTLFWVNIGVGMLLMAAIACLSQLIAWFYNDARLVGITLALSSGLFFGGLTIQHQALLRRQMKFGILTCIQVVSMALSVITGIWLAWHDFGYWALVWKEVFRSVFIVSGTWLACPWWPGLPRRDSGIGSMLKLGRDVTGFNIIHFLSRSLDQILIGKFAGAGPLGLYRQSSQLLTMPMNQLVFSFNSVALPSMSALRNEPAKYRRYYEKAISILSFISMPLAIYACVFSEGLIQLILGDKWIQSADILRILAVGAFIQPITSACGIVMVSYGKTKEYFLWGLMSALCVVIAFSVGIAWGPIGIAAAYSIFNYVILMPSLFYSFRNTPMSVSSLFKAISHPLIASLITGFVLMSIHQQTSLLGNIAEIVITLPLAVVIYGSVWALLPGGRARLGEFFSYLQTIIKSAPITVKQDA